MKVPKNQIFQGDCVQGMKSLLPDGCVDLVLTDPPFGIGFGPKKANYRRKESHVLQGYQEIPEGEYRSFTDSWLTQACRATRRDGSIYIISGWNGLRDILNAAHAIPELTLVNHIIWQYPFGVATKRKFVTSHYHVLYFCKGEETAKSRTFHRNARVPDLPPGSLPENSFPGMESSLREPGQSARRKALEIQRGKARYADLEDVWSIPREYWPGETKTPTKLPWELVAKILAYSSDEGDLVLDPFLGSGQVPVAAQAMRRGYLGWEMAPEHFEFAKKRLTSRKYRES